MKNLKNLRCMGQKHPMAITDSAYFCWESITGQTSVGVEIIYNNSIVFNEHYTTENPFCFIEKMNLEPFRKYFYRITVFVEEEKAAFGEEWFISGKKDIFSGIKWISDGRHFVDFNDEIGSAATYYKKVFTLDNVFDPAVVTVCGLGLHELYINGIKADDRVLEPAFTEYDKKVLYSSYNVTDYVKTGENCIEITLGDGWYNQSTRDTWGFYRAPWREYPKLAISFDCGDRHFESDESFSVSYGNITRSALRLGEVTDFNARKNYFPVSIVTPPGGCIKPSFLPSIRECETIAPVAVYRGDNCTVYDFGVNIAGYVGAYFTGKKGTEIRIEYSDRLKNGKCDNQSNSMYIFNAKGNFQTDVCILSGNKDFYKPKFVYHGFRYITVTDGANVEDINAYFVHTDLERGGKFECSSKILNDLYEMSIRALLSNYHGFPTDCPHREKNGWTGDAQLSLETSIYNFDMQYAYEKWLDDIKVSQRESGQIPAIVPTCGWGYNWGSGPAWDVAFFKTAYALYYYYGDEHSAEKAYPYLKKYYNYLSSFSRNGLISLGLGDWNYPKNIVFKLCPVELTDSCYYMYMSEILTELSERFSPKDSCYYRNCSYLIKNAILEKYSDEESLTGMAALTYFGITDKTQEVVKYLEKNNYTLHTGILGAKYVLSVLGKAGLTDVGVKVLSRTDYPSFGYWIKCGQTTLCEDFELTNSLNHHMYSSVAEFMTRYICGIEIKKNGVVECNPCLPDSLDYASASLVTRKGKFEVYIERKKGYNKAEIKISDGAEMIFEGKSLCSGRHVLKFHYDN